MTSGSGWRGEKSRQSAKLRNMYTRCPQCQTTFNATTEQLAARGGVVRCGQCSTVFLADDHIVQELPDQESTTNRLKPVSQSVATQTADKGLERDPLTRPETSLPTVDELLGRKPSSRTRTVYWLLGNLALLITLLGQGLYFYYDDLAQNQDLRPMIFKLCSYFDCKVSPLADVSNIELAKTYVRPHKKYENALQIRARLINRADFPQPFPLMEVTLTNSKGELVARRTFRPDQYMKKFRQAAGLMPTNVALRASLNVTNPDNQARNFEILLLANR